MDVDEHEHGAQVERFLVDAARRAIGAVRGTEADRDVIRHVRELATRGDTRSFFELVAALGAPMTPGLWAYVLLVGTVEWDEPSRQLATHLPGLRAWHPSSGAPQEEELLDAAAAMLASLGGDTDAEDFVSAPYRLARAAERCGDAEVAYDLAAAAMELGEDAHPLSEEVARYALAVATAAGRPQQVAACSAQLAAVLAAAADGDPSRRLEAFDAGEAAVERLGAVPEQAREPLAERLARALSTRAYLQPLLLPIFHLLPVDRRRPGAPETGGNRQPVELRLDAARLALEPPPVPEGARGDWTAWRLDHPAYRNAVPFGRAVLRETGFDDQLLVLAHEVTRELCLNGALGAATTCLRVAALDAETRLWVMALGDADPALHERMAGGGVAPLRDGDVVALFRAEQALELTRKAQLLQDTWTPWVEGLATLGEGVADPALDAAGTTIVAECLRHLAELAPDDGAARDGTAPASARDALRAELEARCARAIRQRGAARLLRQLREQPAPYGAGYLAARAVVAAWRHALGRPLDGAEAFGALLYATRFATDDAIPDLSLPADRFAADALARMRQWMAQLAVLPRARLEELLAAAAGLAPAAHPDAMLDVRLRQAMLSLARPDDEARQPRRPEEAHRAYAVIARTLRDRVKAPVAQWLDDARQIVGAAGFLPVGRASARFHLRVDPETGQPLLEMRLRTTEHAEHGAPGVDTVRLPVSAEVAEAIARERARGGRSRLDVVRVIDLGGATVPDRPRPGLHLLALRHGDWFDVHGATPEVDALLDRDPAHRAAVRELVRARLDPSPLVRMELEVIVPGVRGAARTRDWIAATRDWHAQDVRVDAHDWARRVHALADRLLAADDERRTRRRDAARALVEATLGDPALAAALSDGGFDALTAELPEERDAIANALFATAQRPAADDVAAYAAGLLLTLRAPLLVQAPHGWDVRPAEPRAPRGA